MDCSPPGSSVHGDSPGRNTGVGCHALFQGSSQPRDQIQVSHIAGGFFTSWATREALPNTYMSAKSWMGLRWFLGISSLSAYGQLLVSLSLAHLQQNIENRQKNNLLFFFVLTCPGPCFFFFFCNLMSHIHFVWGTESLFSPPQEDFAFSVFKKRIGMSECNCWLWS